jgi:hypothetical protein
MGQAMVEPNSPEEFAPTPEHEYQDSHYHDEEPDIVADDVGEGVSHASVVNKKKMKRRPPPRPRYFED